MKRKNYASGENNPLFKFYQAKRDSLKLAEELAEKSKKKTEPPQSSN